MTTKKGLSTRAKILDSTMAVIEESGEAAVRVQEIAAATGVSTSSIYYFFQDRESLVIAAQAERYSRHLDELWAMLDGIQHEALTREQFQLGALRILESSWLPERASFRMQRMNVLGSSMGRPQLQEKISATQRQALNKLREFIQPAQERGWIRPELDADALSVWLLGLILQRTLIELESSTVDGAQWNAVAGDAFCLLFFGCTATALLSNDGS